MTSAAPSIIYLDTSVIGGFFDPEFWKQIEVGLIRPAPSILVEEEIAGAPSQVRDLFMQTFTDPDLIFDFTSEMENLAELYLKHKIVTRKYSQDAGHVAVCSVERIEYLASWNYKHLANAYRNKGFNGVNLLHGYPSVAILNPAELLQP